MRNDNKKALITGKKVFFLNSQFNKNIKYYCLCLWRHFLCPARDEQKLRIIRTDRSTSRLVLCPQETRECVTDALDSLCRICGGPDNRLYPAVVLDVLWLSPLCESLLMSIFSQYLNPRSIFQAAEILSNAYFYYIIVEFYLFYSMPYCCYIYTVSVTLELSGMRI